MKKIAFILLAITFIFPSCYKSELSDSADMPHDSPSNSVFYSDDIIVLQNATELKTFMEYIKSNQNDADHIIDYIKEKFNVTTMREIYEYGMNNVEDYKSFIEYVNQFPNVFFIEEYAEDEVFFELAASNISSFLLNKDGCLIINDTMLYINKDGSHLYSVEKIATEDGYTAYRPKDLIRFTDNARQTRTLKDGEYSYRTVYYENSRRLVARLYFWEIDYGSGTMREYEARSTAQRKQLGIWIQVRIDQIGISHESGTANHVGGSTKTFYPYSYSQNNRADIRQTLHSSASYYPVDHSTSSLLLKHFGTWDSNYGYKEITNNELFP